MEIQPLFYSKLPLDIIYKIYGDVVYNRRLQSDLKDEIYMFNKLWTIFAYYDFVYGTERCGYVLLETDLLWELNDNMPLEIGISPKLLKEYPWISTNYLKLLSFTPHKTTIFKIWSLMNIHKKKSFIQSFDNNRKLSLSV